MRSLLNLVFDTTRYGQTTARYRAYFVYGITLFLLVLFTLLGLFAPFPDDMVPGGAVLTLFQRTLNPALYPGYALTTVVFYLLSVITIVSVRQGFLDYIALGPAAMIYVATINSLTSLGIAEAVLVLAIIVLLAGLTANIRGLVLALSVAILTLVASLPQFGVTEVDEYISLVVLFLLFGGMTFAFLRLADTERQQGTLNALQQQDSLSRLTSRLIEQMSEANPIQENLARVVDATRDALPQVYHAQVFLTSENGREAELVASTGDAGQKLLAREHSLPVGSISVIGQVTQRNEAMAVPVGDESIHRPNDLLPDTVVEAAIPLRARGRVIGALDLQSTERESFSERDLQLLQTVADGLAISIDNTRLQEETQANLEENQKLIERLRAAREDADRMNRELIGSTWSDYLRGLKSDFNMDVDLEANDSRTATSWTEALEQALKLNEVISHEQHGQHVVAVPLRVRGEVIGAIEFEVENPTDLSGDEIDLLTDVSERFGLAAENSRLFEQSQRLAQREALVNEIGSRIQAANSVEATVAAAARSMRDALKAKHVAIRLGKPPKENR